MAEDQEELRRVRDSSGGAKQRESEERVLRNRNVKEMQVEHVGCIKGQQRLELWSYQRDVGRG